MRISPKNAKLGPIPNVSTIPIKDCGENAKHCKDDCYALKAWRQYPNVRAAWKENSQQFRKYPDSAFSELSAYLAKKRPPFFRIHVSGDFLDQDNLDGFVDLAHQFPETKFLAFTKMHQLDFSAIPDNLQIVLSMWPTLNTVPDGLPKAWYQDGTETRIPDNAIHCPGYCHSCGMCWQLNKIGRDVFFNAH